MTLVDFFTQAEMEHGLTTLSRIEELVSVMQEEDRNLDDVSEASRQWLTVASAISATNDKNCLDLFITQDGPSFIAKWLKHAMNIDSASELVISLLKVLEKLHADGKRPVSSDVSEVVRDLLWHGCSAIQETARMLFESWNLAEDGSNERVDKSSEDGDDVQAGDRASSVVKQVSEEQGEASEVSKRMEYGMVDALEVACQVAKEVEREVEDFAEPYCSSSSNKGSDPHNSESKGDDQSHVVDSSLITEANPERALCDFDLNQEIDVEDDECPSINPAKPEPLDIDLNVAEVDPTFGESGIDLNRVTDDFDAQPQARLLSPASSSSSVPLPRNIDLNGPSLNNESSDHGSNLGEFSFGSYADKPAERVIYIMGKRVIIGGGSGGGSPLPRPSHLSNGSIPDFCNGLGFGVAPTAHYPHSPVYYGLNGISPGGAFPYMIDSRGIPVVPQIMPFPKTYPYPMSTFGVGPSHLQSFDLNSSLDDGNREPPFLRQLLVNGDARAAMEDHMVINAQSSLDPGICGKRKEPEGGWDPYPFAVRRQMPPWR